MPPGRNIIKTASIAGFILGELMMLYVVLAPRASGEVVPLAHTIKAIAVSAVFFGPFGALVGGGIGLLISALFSKR